MPLAYGAVPSVNFPNTLTSEQFFHDSHGTYFLYLGEKSHLMRIALPAHKDPSGSGLWTLV